MRNLSLCLISFIAIAANLDAKLSVLWEKEYGDEETLSYTAHDAVHVNDVLQVIGHAFDPKNYSTGNYWFWQIDNSGTRLAANSMLTVFNERSSTIGFGSWRAKGLKFDEGTLYCAGRFGTDELSLSKFGTTNKNTSRMPLQPNPLKTSEDIEKGYAENILKMIPLSNGCFLFVGSDTDSNGFAKKTDSSGNVVWHRSYKKGTISFITDAVEAGSSLILLECYTDADPVKNPYEGYHCRLVRCNLEGEVLSEKSFVGGSAFHNKHPELHKIGSTSFLIGYDRYSLPNQMGYIVSAYDDTLKPLWEKAIADKAEPSRIPIYAHVLPVSSGGFVAAYNEMSPNEMGMNIKVELYSAAGELSASLSLPNYITIDDFQLVGSDKNLFVIALTMPDEVTYRVKVKIAEIVME